MPAFHFVSLFLFSSSAEVLMLLLAELLILMEIGLEGLPGMREDASEGEAVLTVTLRRKDGGDGQRDQDTDTGIDDTGDGVWYDAFLTDREHHDEIHDSTRLNRGVRAECQVAEKYEAEAEDHPFPVWYNEERVRIECIKRDDQQTTDEGTDETVETIMEALFELAADAVDRTDQREAGIPILEQVFIDDGRRQHDQRTAPYTIRDTRKTKLPSLVHYLFILNVSFTLCFLCCHQPAPFAGYS